MNLHIQLFSAYEVNEKGELTERGAEYDLITSGAPTVHALGFKKGGLLALEESWRKARTEVVNHVR